MGFGCKPKSFSIGEYSNFLFSGMYVRITKPDYLFVSAVLPITIVVAHL